jgi:hypothetical protein
VGAPRPRAGGDTRRGSGGRGWRSTPNSCCLASSTSRARRRKIEEQRRRVCAGLHGDVVELGFGSGLNVPLYPAGVTGVAAIEPADTAWKLHFIEHGWRPTNRSDAGNADWNRCRSASSAAPPIVDLVKDAGFTITELDVFYESGALKPMGADSLGIAVAR